MMVGAMLSSCESRRWGDCDDNDGKEEVVEVDNNETTTMSTPPPPATTDPTPPRQIHPPPPSPVSPVGGGWRLDVGNANADGVDAMAGCGNR